MAQPTSLPHFVRVGGLHINLDSGDVMGNGTRTRLQVQSLELLKALLEHPGPWWRARSFGSACGRTTPLSISTMASMPR